MSTASPTGGRGGEEGDVPWHSGGSSPPWWAPRDEETKKPISLPPDGWVSEACAVLEQSHESLRSPGQAPTQAPAPMELDLSFRMIGAGREVRFADVRPGAVVSMTPEQSGRGGCVPGRDFFSGVVIRKEADAVVMRWNDPASGGPPARYHIPMERPERRYWWDGDGGARAALPRRFTTALHLNQTVVRLDLSCCCLFDDGAAEIFRAVSKFTAVQKLNMSGNFIGPQGARAFADCLRVNDTLDKVSLFHNEIGDEGAGHIARAFYDDSDPDAAFNNRLTHLNLRENCIGDVGAQELIRAIEPRGLEDEEQVGNTALVVLWVANNPAQPLPVSPERLRELQEVHQRQTRLIVNCPNDDGVSEGLNNNAISQPLLDELRRVLTAKNPAPPPEKGKKGKGKEKKKKKDDDTVDPEKMFWTPPGTPKHDDEELQPEPDKAKDKKKKK